jgi:glycosyltransferase involved in cell wall biosynthesis
MTMRVAVVGPAHPAEFFSFFDQAGADKLAALPGLGGTPVNALVRALLGSGVQVDLVTLDPTIEAPVVVRGDSLDVLVGGYRPSARLRATDLFKAERRVLGGLLRESTADVLHAQWTYEFAWAGLASGRPCLVTAHDAPLTVLRLMPDPYRAVRAAMAVRVARASSHMTAVSPDVAKSWRRQMRYRGSMAVVPNIVEQADEPVRSSATRATDSAPVLLSVGSGTALKNIRTLVLAFDTILGYVPGARLTLVGPGLGQDGDVCRWARGRGLGAGVDFLGPRPHGEVLELMQTASLLCHPSLEESFGMAVAEAMAVGLPVVAGARSGAVPWLLETGSSGCLTDVRDPAALAAALVRVLTDRAYAEGLSIAGRRRAKDFSASAAARAYLAAYVRVAGSLSVDAGRGAS